MRFAPIPAPPGVADVDDNGYLDIVYFGDLNGRVWRMSLSGASCSGCGGSSETLTGFQPSLLYDAMTGSERVQPIFLEPAIILISGGGTPVLGVGFGTGYRAELLQANANANRFTFVIDPGTNDLTFQETNLVNITPSGGVSPAGTGPAVTGPCTDTSQANCGYFLDFAQANEKAVSTVFSSLGNLELVTFLPASTDVLCGSGSSFNYKTGRGTYNPGQTMGVAGQLSDYQHFLGEGFVTMSQSQGQSGKSIETLIFDDNSINQTLFGTLKTLSGNWKEQ
jgi:Tfp pilus tip-associated adhesin PilY1